MANFSVPDMDQELLAELQDIMGGDFATLVESWQRDTAMRVEGIKKAIDQNDPAQLRQVAHSLKGSSSNLGARCVVDVCIELETLANLNELKSAKSVLSKLSSAIACAEQELVRLAS